MLIKQNLGQQGAHKAKFKAGLYYKTKQNPKWKAYWTTANYLDTAINLNRENKQGE